MKSFLWHLFAKGLDVLTLVFGMRAAKTPTPWDDELVKLFEKIGDAFVPGKTTDDGAGWIDVPALTSGDKGRVVRSVGAIVMKELLLNPDFRTQAKLDDMQADRLLIAALTFLKPESVDTPEEVQEILDAIKSTVL